MNIYLPKNKDFEWLIIDDGSTDGTDILCNNWNSESSFTLRYIKDNGVDLMSILLVST